MEVFISQAMIILPLVGVNILRTSRIVQQQNAAQGISSSPVFELVGRRNSVTATAQEIDGEFTVLKGSQAYRHWTGGVHGYAKLWDSLVKDGTLVATSSGAALEFIHHQVFRSPSAAAAVVTGRAANGREEWKVKGSTTTFGEWQLRGVETAIADQGAP
jgi:hypothetical protein